MHAALLALPLAALLAPVGAPPRAPVAPLARVAPVVPLAPLALEPALRGPPAICHPLEIGDAPSLPWGSGAFSIDRGYDLARLVPDTVALLDGSDDLLVHMETLRRATILVTGLGTSQQPSAAARDARVDALLAALTERLDRALTTPGTDDDTRGRDVGTALFDLGYARAALSQAGPPLDDDGEARLRKAAALLADDPAARLGVVLATCGHGTPSAVTWRHLDSLFGLVEDREDAWAKRVAANAVRIVGPFLGATDREQLAALARDRRPHG